MIKFKREVTTDASNPCGEDAFGLQKQLSKIAMAALLTLVIGPKESDANPVHDAMQEYTEFATYDAGIILPAQITEDIFESVTFVDTRSREEFDTSTIPGAMHIEWRDVFGSIEDIPTDRKTILFCNTGALSAQVGFGLRVNGYDNVLILQGGYFGWLADAAYKPAD